MFSEEKNDAQSDDIKSGEKESKKPVAKKAAPKKAVEENTETPKAKKPKATSKTEADDEAKSDEKAVKAKKVAEPKTEKAEEAPKPTAPKAKTKKVDSAEKIVRIRIEDIKPADGSRRLLTRVGRGRATGHGKTCRRGHNGEGQRAGRSLKRGFEGGQMPMYRRMPKINGFKIIRNKTWLELTTKQLETLSKRHGSDLSAQKLEALGLYNPRRMYGIRIYGNLAVTQSVKVQAHHVTEGAKAAIEKAGGSVSSLSA